jgi:hypothetical protein
MATDTADQELTRTGFDYWQLCDELTVIQAALLIGGCDPSRYATHVEEWDPEKRPDGYEAAKTAISNALRKGAIKGKLIPIYEYNINGGECGVIDDSINVHTSRVDVESLRSFLGSRGFRSEFFFLETANVPDHLDHTHPRFAPKLAAAVRAWHAVTDPGGKHPKKALAKYLRDNAANLGIANEDGKPNETGIEEIAKVANWQPSGGAPKTPSE